ncbi:hypothetical protein [Shewanella xiamenensis]|uniref:hypothetical protein n=1 Tax=Shewanella xiamenensis TaxID=332186 RepID=UPI0024A6787B|nr:hypothetical protein [Shewanella xiamenensis]MDI5874829.1 hypothetical protein [Shewanella xiamenensis]
MRNKNAFDLVIYLSIVSIFIALSVSAYLYGKQLGHNLSSTGTDWATFGSFFGGVFSPMVSFVTLIAIIQTIKLQRELLENQSNEFTKLHNLQVQTFQVQESQLTHAKELVEQEKISTYKQTLLTVIAQRIELHQKVIDRATDGARFLLTEKMKTDGLTVEPQLTENIETKESYEKKVSLFHELAIKIAITKYSSIAELDREFGLAYLKI